MSKFPAGTDIVFKNNDSIAYSGFIMIGKVVGREIFTADKPLFLTVEVSWELTNLEAPEKPGDVHRLYRIPECDVVGLFTKL